MMNEQDAAQRRHAVAWAIALTADTALAPDQYERELLHSYAQGALSLEQVLEQLDTRVQHLLYRSQAQHLLSSAQLTDLLQQSQALNEVNQITGLLCYSDDGHFVQVIEGSARDVHALYAKIQQDRRHCHVTLLGDKASATRWFADWRMALVHLPTNEFYWLLGYLEAKGHNPALSQVPINEPQLLTLLQQFSQR